MTKVPPHGAGVLYFPTHSARETGTHQMRGNAMSKNTVVVGIDGGPASLAALRTAIHEARLRDGRVVALTCFPLQRHQQRVRPSDAAVTTFETANELLETVIGDAGEADASDIVREVSNQPPGPALIRLSKHAELLVLGASIDGLLARFMGGSVMDQCLSGSTVPVLIVSEVSDQLLETEIDAELHIPASQSA